MEKFSFTIPFLFYLLTMLCSCSDVHFEKPQPVWISKNETTIPKNIQGYYTDGKDTLRITEKRIVDNKNKPDFDLNLSDSFLLKIYNHNYFLNMRSEENKWTIMMANVAQDYLILYGLSFKDSAAQNRLKEITTVKEIKDSSGQIIDYIINPTSEEFRKILDQKLFNVASDTMKKIK